MNYVLIFGLEFLVVYEVFVVVYILIGVGKKSEVIVVNMIFGKVIFK